MRLAILALASAALVGHAPAASAQPNRDRVVAALQQLLATGRPAHVEHDSGAQLQADVKALLETGDPELLDLARRAAAPIVPSVSHPIGHEDAMPSVRVETRPVLEFPPPDNYRAAVFASIDAAPWIAFCEVGPASSCGLSVGQMSEAAAAPGFHTLKFRTVVRHEDGEVETRTLQTVTYGVTGVDHGTPDNRDPAAYLRAAARGPASSLEAGLPEQALDDWPQSLRATVTGLEPVDWVSEWYGLDRRAHLLEFEQQQVCTTARTHVAETGVVAEVSVGVGAIEWAGDVPKWTRQAPALVRTLVRRSRSVWLPSLAQLPVVLATPEDNWPRAVVSVEPGDIVYVPAPNARGRGTFVVRTTLSNRGHADLHGLQVALMAVGAAEDRPILDRQRLVDLPAGGTAVLTERVAYPTTYGVFVVQLRASGDAGPYGEMSSLEDPRWATTYRVLNPQAAPHGYARRISAALCSSECRGY